MGIPHRTASAWSCATIPGHISERLHPPLRRCKAVESLQSHSLAWNFQFCAFHGFRAEIRFQCGVLQYYCCNSKIGRESEWNIPVVSGEDAFTLVISAVTLCCLYPNSVIIEQVSSTIRLRGCGSAGKAKPSRCGVGCCSALLSAL